MVGIRFEQHGIHVRVARYAGRFGLHGLRPPYLKPFGSGVRGERHVLCLERSRAVTVLPENAAQSRCQYALAHVAPVPANMKGCNFLMDKSWMIMPQS